MLKLTEIFQVKVTRDRLQAYLHLKTKDIDTISLKEAEVIQYLQKNKISYGLKHSTIKAMVENFPNYDFPFIVAEGVNSVAGEDGSFEKLIELSAEVDRSEGWNFREVMKIPTVKEETPLAKIIPPTQGKEGVNVYGQKIKARPGKPYLIRAGKNVRFNEQNQTFYATVEGQVAFEPRVIHVHNVYEVHETISMKIGNINFPGTVIIHGDIPAGYTVEAAGDIKVFGMVEAATVIAGGTVYITEGFAGYKTGYIESGVDVQVGYVNQGTIKAKNDILVENSIRHAICTAGNDIVSQRGNIIGGKLTAGATIRAKDFGNRMNTATHLAISIDSSLMEELNNIQEEKEKVLAQIKQIETIKAKMDAKTLTAENRILLLKLTHSSQKLEEQLEELNEREIVQQNILSSQKQRFIRSTGTLYQNVTLSFGKYERKTNKDFDYATVKLDKNDIVITNY